MHLLLLGCWHLLLPHDVGALCMVRMLLRPQHRRCGYWILHVARRSTHSRNVGAIFRNVARRSTHRRNVEGLEHEEHTIRFLFDDDETPRLGSAISGCITCMFSKSKIPGTVPFWFFWETIHGTVYSLISPGPWSLRPNCTQFVGLFFPLFTLTFFFWKWTEQ